MVTFALLAVLIVGLLIMLVLTFILWRDLKIGPRGIPWLFVCTFFILAVASDLVLIVGIIGVLFKYVL